MKEFLIVVAILAVAVLITVALKMTERAAAAECEAKGGVLIQGVSKQLCLEAQVIR